MEILEMKIRLYRWIIDYDTALAENWLNWKLRTATDHDQEHLDLVISVVKRGKQPPLTPISKNLIAEYLAYLRAPRHAKANLFYVIDETGDMEGWSIFEELGSPNPLAIKVVPEEFATRDVTIAFTQPGYTYTGETEGGLRITGKIKDFKYTVEFKVVGTGANALNGTLWHPDFCASDICERVRVGKTRLVLRYAGDSNGAKPIETVPYDPPGEVHVGALLPSEPPKRSFGTNTKRGRRPKAR